MVLELASHAKATFAILPEELAPLIERTSRDAHPSCLAPIRLVRVSGGSLDP